MTTEFLLETFRRVNDQQPWYGSSVTKIITRELDPNTQTGSAHSIGQILQHMISWRKFAIEKLKGNADFKIEPDSKINFDPERIYTQDEYQNLVREFQQCQEEIISLIETKEGDAWLKDTVPGSKYSMRYLMQGIIQHDVYHAGQIALLHASVS